ncbi:hypothetical protein M514_02858 [Trichuris suis]|uniref:Uncharacterized protein n=1 Tax=Trichuris suis TaxID=68888 RepID=A0A085MGQ7_9BILA|nr:hypothetical protein M513_02858 [Trichuris suis]KFD67967.1 hypothetical protein M514_02858 [Trichuris suis]
MVLTGRRGPEHLNVDKSIVLVTNYGIFQKSDIHPSRQTEKQFEAPLIMSSPSSSSSSLRLLGGLLGLSSPRRHEN